MLQHAKNRDDGLSQWLNALPARKHTNIVTVALANKTGENCLGGSAQRHGLRSDACSRQPGHLSIQVDKDRRENYCIYWSRQNALPN